MKNDELKYTKKSLWGELNALSGVALAVIAGIVILSIAAFIFMNRIPPKRTKIIDDAGIFSSEEYADLEDAAEKLKDDNDINVVVVTTRDNPNGTDDSDCRKYAADVYKKYCIHTSMQDNSGICILIDLTLDFPGGRYFWLYTYGTAYFAVDSDECNRLFGAYRKELGNGEYYTSIRGIFGELADKDYHSTGLILTYGACIIIPLILAAGVTLLCTHRPKLDPVPKSKQYIDRPNSRSIEVTDTFVRKNTRVYHTSSSSGGGGGGGGFSGGGGGGHSGGGGGRF